MHITSQLPIEFHTNLLTKSCKPSVL